MPDSPKTSEHCPHCGTHVAKSRYVQRTDGTYRCEHCYFKDTYLDGIVSGIETSHLVTLEALMSAIDAREHEVGDHSLRVTQFAVIMGHAFGLSGKQLVDLYCGALLHDIGKIGVPDAVLLKKGPLTPEERSIMQGHPEIGHGIISRIGYFAEAAEIIRSHHEHFDGSGYPRGLKGADIPVGARVFSIADALDALTVRRPYHDAVRFDEATKEILKGKDKNFDPAAIDAFVRSSAELKDCIGKIVLDGMPMDHLHPPRGTA